MTWDKETMVEDAIKEVKVILQQARELNYPIFNLRTNDQVAVEAVRVDKPGVHEYGVLRPIQGGSL